MIYRYLGNTGIQVSVIGYGNMFATYDEKTYEVMRDSVKFMLEKGVNFFDTAEYYGFGKAEEFLGRVFKELKTPREDVVVTTKLFKGDVNNPNGVSLSRKHLIEGIKKSLRLLQMEYVDVLYCHKPDDDCPLEETLKAMDWIIR